MTYARKDFMQADKCGTFHLYARCIRRCFLLGHDEESGKDYSGRKEWIPLRLAALRKTFLIDILAYAVIPNHYHIILNNRPDLVKNLSTKEVVSRWLLLHPTVAMKDEKREKPTSTEIAKFIEDFEIAEIRLRHSDISWFMRELNQYIAVKANREEGLTGAFFDGRFKSLGYANRIHLKMVQRHQGQQKSIRHLKITSRKPQKYQSTKPEVCPKFDLLFQNGDKKAKLSTKFVIKTKYKI